MRSGHYWFFGLFVLLSLNSSFTKAQKNAVDSSEYFNKVKTYVNPVLPGDHPDPTLLKVGNDFIIAVRHFISILISLFITLQT